MAHSRSRRLSEEEIFRLINFFSETRKFHIEHNEDVENLLLTFTQFASIEYQCRKNLTSAKKIAKI